MKPTVLCVFCALALSTFSCKDNSVDAELPSKLDGIVPLATGNVWARYTDSWDSAGHPAVQLIDTLSILGDTVIKNERWFLFNHYTHATNRSSGFYLLSGATPVQYLKYPVSLGDGYLYGSDTVRVAHLDTVITVTAGTFSCLRYEFTYNGFVDIILYAAPHKGIIRFETFGRTAGGTTYLRQQTDLASVHLN